MFANMAELLSFILVGLALDFFIFHYFRKDGDRFDGEDQHIKGTISNYINCCFCHGFLIGICLTPLMISHSIDNTIGYQIIGGLIISISTLTYRIMVLKE